MAYIFFWSSCECTKHKESNPIRLLSGKSCWKPYKSSSPLLALFITLIGRAVYLEKNTSKHFIKFYRKMFSGSKKGWVELVYLHKFVSPIWAFAIGNYHEKWFLYFEVLLRYKTLWFPVCVCYEWPLWVPTHLFILVDRLQECWVKLLPACNG